MVISPRTSTTRVLTERENDTSRRDGGQARVALLLHSKCHWLRPRNGSAVLSSEICGLDIHSISKDDDVSMGT